VLLAVARALERHPLLNAAWTDDGIDVYADVNLGFAVAVGDGLVVPVIRVHSTCACATSPLDGASSRGGRAGRIGLDELSGGTFTVTSLADYAVRWFTPILNPPRSRSSGSVGSPSRSYGATGRPRHRRAFRSA